MPSFETPADIFTCLSVFDEPLILYLTRLKARQILLRLIKYQSVFQKKVPNNIFLLRNSCKLRMWVKCVILLETLWANGMISSLDIKM